MTKQVEAVYETGTLRPLGRVTIEVSDEPEPTLEEVRRALSPISGKLSDAVRAERDARG